MPNNDNYIGVAMGLDVTDLKAGLKEAGKRIGEANAEFKATASTMEDWQKSTDGVAAKVKQLDSVLSAQKSKLAGLQAEYEKVAAAQGEGSDAARNLMIKIQNQQAVVNQTQREFDNYSETLKQAQEGNIDLSEVVLKNGKALEQQAEAAEDSGSKLEGLKGAAGAVAGGLAAIGGAVAGAVTGFLSLAESTREVRENMARLDTSFESVGLTAEQATDTYNTLYGVLGDTGRATEAAQQLAKISENEEDLLANTTILTGVMAEYGDSIPTEGLAEGMAATAAMGSVQGVLADALEWQGVNLDDYNAKLAEMATEEERAAFVQQSLLDIYGESAAAFQERNADIIAAREAEAALSQTTAELGAIAEPIMTTLKTLANELLQSITPMVELIGEGLTGALNGTEGAAETLAEGLGGIINVLVEKVTEMLPTVLNIILELVPQIISTLLSALPELVATVAQLVTDIINMLSELLPEIVTAIIEIVPQIIDALVNAIPELIKAAISFFMAIVEAIPEIISALTEALPDIITTVINGLIEGTDALINGAVQLLMAIVDAIPQIITALTDALPQIITAIVDGITNAVPQLLEAAITLLMAIIEAIPEIVSALTEAMPEIINAIIEALKENYPKMAETAFTLFMEIVKAIPKIVVELVKALGELWQSVTEMWVKFGQSLKKWAGDLISKAAETFGKFVTTSIEKIKALPSEISKWLKEALTKVINWGKDLASKGKQAAADLFNSIVDKVKKIPSEMLSIGKDIVRGLWDGINNMTSWVKSKIEGFGDSVVEGLKDFFGIASPAKLIEKEVGVNVGKAVVPSRPSALASVKKSLNEFSGFVTDNLGGIKAGLAIESGNVTGAAASGGAAQSNNYNFVQNNYSPKALSRMEIYRQTKNQVALIKGVTG